MSQLTNGMPIDTETLPQLKAQHTVRKDKQYMFRLEAGLSFCADLWLRLLNLPMRWRATRSMATKGPGGVNPWRHLTLDRGGSFVLLLTPQSQTL
jgi:hypothetical protein